MNIFDVLNHGPIVWFDEEEAVLITWNENRAFSLWKFQDNDFVSLESWPAEKGMKFEQAREAVKVQMTEVFRLLKAMD